MPQQISRWCLISTHVLKHIMVTIAAVSLTQAVVAGGNCFWPGRWGSSHNEKKFNGVKSGDLGGHTIDVLLLNHPPGFMWLRWFLTSSTRSITMIVSRWNTAKSLCSYSNPQHASKPVGRGKISGFLSCHRECPHWHFPRWVVVKKNFLNFSL
jgi:hypothetical protein